MVGPHHRIRSRRRERCRTPPGWCPGAWGTSPIRPIGSCGDRPTKGIEPLGGVRHAGFGGGTSRAIEAPRLRGRCIVIALTIDGLNDIGSVVIRKFGLFQDRVVGHAADVGIGRLVKIVTRILSTGPIEAVVQCLGEEGRTGRQGLRLVPSRVVPEIVGQRSCQPFPTSRPRSSRTDRRG